MQLRIGLLLVAFAFYAPDARAQSWEAMPRFGTIDLAGAFEPDPWLGDMEAGGDFNAGGLGPDCAGFIDQSRPDFDLNFRPGEYTLTIFAVAASDISLVVYTPGGEWICSDDADATNPAVLFNEPFAGNYNIWVGSARAGDIVPAVLGITEGDPDFGVSVPLNGPENGPIREDNRVGGGADSIEWGDDTSEYARDGECDDDRFAGPAVSAVMLDEDRYHDATDCRAAYLAGRIYLR